LRSCGIELLPAWHKFYLESEFRFFCWFSLRTLSALDTVEYRFVADDSTSSHSFANAVVGSSVFFWLARQGQFEPTSICLAFVLKRRFGAGDSIPTDEPLISCPPKKYGCQRPRIYAVGLSIPSAWLLMLYVY
jgi:hypothetical protein